MIEFSELMILIYIIDNILSLTSWTFISDLMSKVVDMFREWNKIRHSNTEIETSNYSFICMQSLLNFGPRTRCNF